MEVPRLGFKSELQLPCYPTTAAVPDLCHVCGEGYRHGSDLVLRWLWHRLVATAPIQPLAWEHPHAAEAAQEIKKKKIDS